MPLRRMPPRPLDDGNPSRIEPPLPPGRQTERHQKIPSLWTPRIVPSVRRLRLDGPYFRRSAMGLTQERPPRGAFWLKVGDGLYWGQRGRMTSWIGADEGDLDEARIADGLDVRARRSAAEHTPRASRFAIQDSCGFGDPFNHNVGLDAGLFLDSPQPRRE